MAPEQRLLDPKGTAGREARPLTEALQSAATRPLTVAAAKAKAASKRGLIPRCSSPPPAGGGGGASSGDKNGVDYALDDERLLQDNGAALEQLRPGPGWRILRQA